MDKKAKVGSKEFIFFSFFSAYLNQDVDDFDEGFKCFNNDASDIEKNNLVKAIDDFFNLPYSKEEKENFIAELSSYTILPEDVFDTLNTIKSFY